jgi:hypothetical protein
MDTILLAVTVLSLAMAAGMAILVVAVLRQDRARSNARIAALGAMAGDPVNDPARAAATVRPRTAAPPAVTVQPRRSQAATLDDLEIRPMESAVAGVSQLFAPPDAPSPWGRRFAVIGALAAVILAFGLIATTVKVHTGAAPPAATPAAQAEVGASAPLELLSLRHVQESDRLVISGVVQNPRNGAPLARVVATAFLFGANGAFLTSGRAPLDFTTLAPGVESPFVVNVPVSGTVTRYRIGFRTEDGRVISHVDRRGPDALAQK